LGLEILSRISIDGAPAMIGKEKGVIKLLIDKIESNNKIHNCCKRDDLFVIHCLIHQRNLCLSIIDELCYASSHKNSELYSITCTSYRQFKEFLKELDFEYGDVVYFSRVRRLYRFYEFCQEIDLFMNGNFSVLKYYKIY